MKLIRRLHCQPYFKKSSEPAKTPDKTPSPSCSTTKCKSDGYAKQKAMLHSQSVLRVLKEDGLVVFMENLGCVIIIMDNGLRL